MAERMGFSGARRSGMYMVFGGPGGPGMGAPGINFAASSGGGGGGRGRGFYPPQGQQVGCLDIILSHSPIHGGACQHERLMPMPPLHALQSLASCCRSAIWWRRTAWSVLASGRMQHGLHVPVSRLACDFYIRRTARGTTRTTARRSASTRARARSASSCASRRRGGRSACASRFGA